MKFYLLATLFSFFCAKSIAQEDRCDPSNVAFIMDMSDTTKNYHGMEKKIVQQIVDKFPENSRFSLVTFGTRVFRRAGFEPDMTAAKFKAIVAKLTGQEEGRQSFLGLAVDKLSPIEFPIEKGKRENNYLFVLTDGHWTLKDKDKPQREQKIRNKASLIVSKGVKRFVFGLGRRADRKVLRGLVPEGQSEKYIINILQSNYNAETVAQKVKKATDKACLNQPAENCQKLMDIGFLLDRSGTIGKTVFKNEVLPYIQNIANYFNISKDETHAGVVVFGNVSDTKVVIEMDEYSDTKSFNSAVQKIEYPKYQQATFINKALDVASKKLFNYQPRRGVKRYVILLTDGMQTSEKNSQPHQIPPGSDPWQKQTHAPEKIAEQLWDKKIDIIAVGFAKAKDSELRKLTNNGTNGKVHMGKNIAELDKSINTVVGFFCKVCKMDLVVVLDVSGSAMLGFRAEKYILLEIARLVQLKQGGSQISVITFSTEGSLNIPFLFEERTYAGFEVNVGQLSLGRSKLTAIESGLNLVPEAMKHSAANNHKKAVLVITDGLQTAGNIQDVKRQADAIRNKGYMIKTMSLHTKSWLKKQRENPLQTLKDISGSDKGNFFIRTPPNRNIEDSAYQKEVEATVKNVLRSICGMKGAFKK